MRGLPADDPARMWLPSLALAGCVRGALLSDTRGVFSEQRPWHNYFPTTPLVSLVWWLQGRACRVVEPGFAYDEEVPFPGDVSFAGPFTLPSQSRGAGPVHVVHLLLAPDAVQAMTGIDPGRFVNRVVDAREVLPADWWRWTEAVRDAPDDRVRFDVIEAFLASRWQPLVRAQSARWRYGHWTQALAARAATSAPGRSLRQIERRVKGWAGLPLRELRAMARAEEAFFNAVNVSLTSERRWAELAADSGYADQAHLCRETRRMTGFTPTELARRLREDERFWAYRIWF
jgi:AraC-like DNA-binding protein